MKRLLLLLSAFLCSCANVSTDITSLSEIENKEEVKSLGYILNIDKTYVYGKPHLKIKITANQSDQSQINEITSLKLTVDKIPHLLNVSNGIAEIDFKKMNFNIDRLPVRIEATIDFLDRHYDISNLLSQFFENEEKRRQSEFLNNLRRECRENIISSCLKLQSQNSSSDSPDTFLASKQLCSLKYKNSCADARNKFKFYSKEDLLSYLDNVAIKMKGGFGLEKEVMLYFGHYLKAVQKVNGGYLIAVDTRVVSGYQYGYSYAFLATKVAIPENSMFCGWFYYAGPYEYISTNGFTQNIPAFKIHNGEAPIRNGDPCHENWIGKNL